LNGLADFADVLILARHYGAGGGPKWDQRDLNYDGRVDFGDLLLLGQHYGQSLGAQQMPQGQSTESR